MSWILRHTQTHTQADTMHMRVHAQAHKHEGDKRQTRSHTHTHAHTTASGYLAAAGGFKTLTGILVTEATSLKISVSDVKSNHERTGLTFQSSPAASSLRPTLHIQGTCSRQFTDHDSDKNAGTINHLIIMTVELIS